MTTFKKPENLQKDEELDTLFRHARSRPKAPAGDEAAIRAATYAEWQKLTGQRKRKRYLAAFGLAASFVLTVILVNGLQRSDSSISISEQLASLEVQSGEVFVHEISADDSTARRLIDNKLYAGQVITTNSDARLALDWQTGESIRIDENSKLALVSVTEIELLSGQVYVDTKHAKLTGASFVVRTFAGPIKHVGTQYLAGVSDRTVTLAVREGKVSFSTGNTDILIHRGELASIGPSGKTDIGPVETFGEMWEWTSLVTPALKLDGLSAFDFVEWAGRETGREVVFLDESTQKLARETRLRGSVSLTPDHALELILQTSDIEAISSDGKILIRPRNGI